MVGESGMLRGATVNNSAGVSSPMAVLPGSQADVYSAAVMADDPAGYWKLHGADTDDLDDSSPGGEHDGSLYDPNNSVSTATDDGLWSGVPAFHAKTDGPGRVDVGSAWFNHNVWSADGWFKSSLDNGVDVQLFDESEGEYPNSSRRYLSAIGGNSGFVSAGQSIHQDEASLSGDVSSQHVGPGAGWHYLAVTSDGHELRFYMDGVSTGETAPISSVWQTGVVSTIRIVDFGCADNCFSTQWMNVSDVAIYSSTLNAVQIQNHYTAAGGVLPMTTSQLFGGSNPSMPCISCAVASVKRAISWFPVDAGTGNFFHTFSDIALPSRGPSFELGRTYNALEAKSGVAGPVGFGAGWSWTFGARLDFGDNWQPGNQVPSSFDFVQEAGARVTFSADGSGGWVPASNVFASIVRNPDQSWTLQRVSDHVTFTFDSQGRLTSVTNRNAYTTTLSWPAGPSGTLIVTDNSGTQEMSVVIDAIGHVTSVSDSAGRSVAYTYVEAGNPGAGNLKTAASLGGGKWTYVYDSGNLMTSMEDPAGGTVVNKFDSQGRVVDQWAPDGSSGAPTDTTKATEFIYGAGYTKITGPSTPSNPDGVIDTQVFQNGYLVSDTVGTGSSASTTTFSYWGENSGAATVTDPSGNISTTTYYKDPVTHLMTSWISTKEDPSGVVTSYSGFDAFGNPGSVTVTGTDPQDPNNVTTTSYTYDPNNGNLKTVSRPWNGTTALTTYTYDPAHPGDATSVQSPDGTMTHYSYAAATGQVDSVTDPAGGVTSFAYDAAGHQVAVTSPEGHSNTFVMNAAGESLISLDGKANGAVDGFVRGNGPLGSANRGGTWSTTGSWSVAGDEASVSGPGTATLVSPVGSGDGLATSMIAAGVPSSGAGLFESDDAGHSLSLVEDTGSGEWVLTKTGGSGAGVLGSFTAPINAGDRITLAGTGTTLLVYRNGTILGVATDADLGSYTRVGLIGSNGAVASGFEAHDLNGGARFVKYDNLGRVTSTMGPRGSLAGYFTTSTAYDAVGRPTAVTDENQIVRETTYDLSGMVTGQVSAHAASGQGPFPTTTYSYDSHGRLASRLDAGNSHATSYVYSDGSAPSTPATVAVTKPSGVVVTSSLDPDGRTASVDYSDTGASPDLSYSYDKDGQVLTATAAGVGPDITRVYDSLGEPVSVTRDGRSVEYHYDADPSVPGDQPGRLADITYPNNQKIVLGYDSQGRWNKVTDWNGLYSSYSYDGDGNVSEIATSNGVLAVRGFDADDQLASISWSGPGFAFPVTYSRGSADELTATTQWGGGPSWGYDPALEVTSSTNPNGSYTYDDANRPVVVNGVHQAFNDAGELCWTSASSGSCASPPAQHTSYGFNDNGERVSVGANTFAFDEVGEMTTATINSTATSYAYGSDGLRTSKTQGAATTDFSWDDSGGVPQLIQDGDTFFVYGPDGKPTEAISPTGTCFVHTDATGSVASTTAGSGANAGQVISTRSYDPYGNVTAHTGDPISLGWQAQYQDPETGYYYLQHRYYDPTTTQFLSPDPLFSVTGDRYGYAGNDPVNGSDPLGLCSLAECAADLATYVGSYTCHRFAGSGNYWSIGHGLYGCGDNGSINAIRHFVGAALFTWIEVTEHGTAYGSFRAWSILGGHEVQGLGAYCAGEHRRVNPYENGAAYNLDTSADWWNNFVGYSVGLELAHEGLTIGEVVRRVTSLAHHYFDTRTRLDFHGGGFD